MAIKNWIKRKKIYWHLFKINVSKLILNISWKINNPRLKILKSLKHHAENKLFSKNFDIISCPQNLKIKLERVCFSDLFFPEDFAKLQQGLKELYSRYSLYKSYHEAEQIDEWFDSIQNASSDYSSIYLGWLFFKDKDDKKLFKKAQIYLCHVNSTFVSLSISIEPSSVFAENFNKLIRRVPLPQQEITNINLKYGFISVRTYSPYFTQNVDLEKLFLKLNENVTILFRSFFESGLGKFGPLPSIEILSINSSLKEIPKNLNSRMPEAMIFCHNFLKSIGYPSHEQKIYKHGDCIEFYEVVRSELFHQTSSTYQMLVSTVDFEENEFSETEDSRLEMIFSSYAFHELLSIFSLEHFYRILKNLIMDLKNELDPALGGQVKGKNSIKRLSLNISRMIMLNGFYFHHMRIWSGVSEASLWKYIGHQAEHFVADYGKEKEPKNLLMFIKRKTDRDKLFCAEQLALLKLSYEQLLTYKTASLNLWFQNITLCLSIAVAILTIATVFPEESRVSFLRSVLVRISHIIDR